jgi:phospholipase D3/4
MTQTPDEHPLTEVYGEARAYLVESIPKGLEDLRDTPGVRYTENVLVELTRQTRSTIDLTVMYWNLLPDPNSPDESGFTDQQFAKMGADTGHALFEALREAAARGVRIRILESPGFSASSKPESATLRDEFPQVVEVFEIDMGRWYGGSGIMHQKLLIFDDRHIYLGSANMDWKSIMQVKEMGIAVENCPELARDATRYFEGWRYISSLPASSIEVFDPSARVNRSVPPWSALVPKEKRAPSPFDDARYSTDHRIGKPLVVNLNGEAGGLFLTGCPAEVRGPGRSYDGDGLVHTIDDARRSVCISVMDFAPVGLYGRSGSGVSPIEGSALIPTDTPVWWPSLIDAILATVLTRKVYVRLLISQWAHTSALIKPLLRSLQQAADAGRASEYLSAGQLEIKQFIIPGWDETTSAHRKFPGHSRVNHTKYIVTDRRINIGTSNMTWDYFASSAGCSLNTDHPSLVQTLQSVFDRDWASPYAYRLS